MIKLVVFWPVISLVVSSSLIHANISLIIWLNVIIIKKILKIRENRWFFLFHRNDNDNGGENI